VIKNRIGGKNIMVKIQHKDGNFCRIGWKRNENGKYRVEVLNYDKAGYYRAGDSRTVEFPDLKTIRESIDNYRENENFQVFEY
jgi:hypothetical protein